MLAAWLGSFWLFAQQSGWKHALSYVASKNQTPIFERNTLWELVWQHLNLCLFSMLLVMIIGLPLALFVTRSYGKPFLGLVSNTVNIGQIFPPTAVLFLFLPIFGFGPTAAIIALFIYGLLPTVRGGLLGLSTIPEDQSNAALGCGMNAWQILWRLEFPQALPSILAGLRTSLILIIATATVAPLVGTGGLGVPIIAGLSTNNVALVLEGALPVALIAVLADMTVRWLEQVLVRWA